jgi:hypothetical protein
MWFCGDLLRRMLMQLLDEHCFETRPQYCRGKRYSGFPSRLALTLRCFFFLQCSTKLLFKVFDCDPRFISRAEDGTQTRDPQLGRLMLYRLSYFRIQTVDDVVNIQNIYPKLHQFVLWAVMDSNHRRLRQLSYSQPHLATLVTAPIKNDIFIYR